MHWRVRAACQGWIYSDRVLLGSCGQKAELDLKSLVWTRGRAFPTGRLKDCLRCLRCGSRELTVMFDVPSEPTTHSGPADAGKLFAQERPSEAKRRRREGR